MKTQKNLTILFAVIVSWQGAALSMQTKVTVPQTAGWLPLLFTALCSLGQPTEEQRRQNEIEQRRQLILSHMREKRFEDAQRSSLSGVINEAVIIEAAKSGNVSLLQMILDCSMHIPWEYKALLEASKSGHVPAMQLIAGRLGDSDPDDDFYLEATSTYKQALKHAAHQGSVLMLEEILKYIRFCFGKDWKEFMQSDCEERSMSILYEALKGKQPDSVRLLLYKGADYYLPGHITIKQVIAETKRLGVPKIGDLILTYHQREKLPEMMSMLSKLTDEDKKEMLRSRIAFSIKLHPSLFHSWRDDKDNNILHKAASSGDIPLFLFILSFYLKTLVDEKLIILAISNGSIDLALFARLGHALREKNQADINRIKEQSMKTIRGCIFFFYVQAKIQSDIGK